MFCGLNGEVIISQQLQHQRARGGVSLNGEARRSAGRKDLQDEGGLKNCKGPKVRQKEARTKAERLLGLRHQSQDSTAKCGGTMDSLSTGTGVVHTEI